jgi:hypothetical protein
VESISPAVKMVSLKETIKEFDAATCILACTDRPLQDRMYAAIIEISSLRERDFNPDFRKIFNQVINQIIAYRDSGNRSDLRSGTAPTILEMCIRLHSDSMELNDLLNFTNFGENLSSIHFHPGHPCQDMV